MLAGYRVSLLVGEGHMRECDSADIFDVVENEQLNVCWAKDLLQDCAAGQQKYSLLTKLVNALLSLRHGNSYCL